MEEILRIIMITLISIPLGICMGMGAVYVFNRMPAKWLCEYGETPSEELTDKSRKRLSDYPYKIIFAIAFILTGIYFMSKDIAFGAAALFEMWLLLVIAISDKKYMIIPDQFVIFLALFAFPMSAYRFGIRDMIAGAMVGGGIFLLAGIMGRLVTRRDSLGAGDIKLMTALGLSFGFAGTVFVTALTSVMSAFVFACGILLKKTDRHDEKPLAPFVAAASYIYLFIKISMF